MQLEVRSFNVTWRRDLWGHRVIVFVNVSNCWLNSYGKVGGATRRRFFVICEKKKPEGGGGEYPPLAVCGLTSLFISFYFTLKDISAATNGYSMPRVKLLSIHEYR